MLGPYGLHLLKLVEVTVATLTTTSFLAAEVAVVPPADSSSNIVAALAEALKLWVRCRCHRNHTDTVRVWHHSGLL